MSSPPTDQEERTRQVLAVLAVVVGMAEFGMGVGGPAQMAMDEIRLLRREIRALKERIEQLEAY